MDALTFFTKLVEHIAWPIVAIIIFLTLKTPIISLLGRLHKAKHRDTVLDFMPTHQNAASRIDDNTNIVDVTLHDPLGLISQGEQRIYSSLEQQKIRSESEKVKVLVKNQVILHLKHT